MSTLKIWTGVIFIPDPGRNNFHGLPGVEKKVCIHEELLRPDKLDELFGNNHVSSLEK
jgi:hypothetical protein